jgi:hypothetical protein
MRPLRPAPTTLALAGAAAIAVGVHQGLVHVAPGYGGSIVTGWGGPLSHEEVFLARLGLVGVVGAVAARRWRRLAVAPAATGLVVLFYTFRAVLHYALEPGLYVEVTTHGTPTRLVLGAEPILLVGGGLLLVGAGVVGWRGPAPDDTDDGETPRAPSTR